jgi:GNAT superfamily N-acetyltransferase
MHLHVLPVDYQNAVHRSALVMLLDAYAHDPMGGGEGLLLAAAEQHARQKGCCKLTLEVLTGNHQAHAIYLRFGFAPYTLDPAAGQASFMQKWL